VETPQPWYERLAEAFRGGGRPHPPPGRHFVGPPDARLVESYKLTKLQVESFDKQISQLQVELHKKFSLSLACLVFVLLGAPLGIVVRRGGMRAGVWSIGFLIFYYICLIGGEQLADRRLLRPAISMWLANVVLGTIGLFLVANVLGLRHRRSSPRPVRRPHPREEILAG